MKPIPFRILCLLWWCLWAAAPALAQPAGAESASGDHVRVRWLAPTAFAAGQQQWVGFYFEVDPGWHVYWRNPGDSGAAPRFQVSPEGARTGAIHWPFPTRLPVAHLTNLGYAGNVAYLLPVTPTHNASAVSLTVDLEWLVCKVDCIPGFGRMILERPVAQQSQWPAGDRKLLQQYQQRIPGPAAASPWQVVSLQVVDADRLQLTLFSAASHPDPPEVFPLDAELIGAATPQRRGSARRWQFELPRVPGASVPASTGLVLSDGQRAWRLDSVAISPVAATPASASSPATPTQPLWLLLLAALAGGLILNLMPCVFPVLSIKLMSVLQHTPEQRRREALGYSAGVLATFAALGALLLVLRAGGSALGWGFQLQSPPVILALIALFWLMALAFSGVFEFGHRLMTWAGSHGGGAFATGMLAVFVATPCTGPFMGVALGAAAVLPGAAAMTLFLGLGLGLAAPYALLCLSPALLRRLPRPGPWMETLRQLLAFPLYATVIWLLWVLGRLLGDTGWLWGSSLMLGLVFVLWLGARLPRWRGTTTVTLAGALLLTGLVSLPPPAATAGSSASAGPWQAYDPDLIRAARARGQGVFVDYTAAWCITCQVNKQLVLDTEPVLQLFQDHNVLLVRADWTRHDPAITQSLARLGRNSVPVYAWYPSGAASATLLHQILQPSTIRKLFTPPTQGASATEATP